MLHEGARLEYLLTKITDICYSQLVGITFNISSSKDSLGILVICDLFVHIKQIQTDFRGNTG